MKVFSLGGSILTENLENLSAYAKAFNSTQEQLIIVTGAGELKKYVETISANHAKKDLVGIEATRLNAKTLATEAEANAKIPETVEQLQQLIKTGEDVYMGGLTPGYSTDAVAAIAAETFESELFIASDVRGVYTRHPEEKDAELKEKVAIDELRQLSSRERKAGGHSLIDPTAIDIIERSDLETKFIKGTPENLSKPAETKGTKLHT